MMEKQKHPVFELGLAMAGAVSAGAYTAGVMDFLMEALETWERKKEEDKDVPTHQLKIKVITGASAGSIAAAVFASSLRNQQFPFQQPSPLWKTWVDEVDIFGLLGINDFKASGQGSQDSKPEVKSVLDSTFLDAISENVLAQQQWNRTDWPVYLSDPLQLYFTVTNLRGIPYSIKFKSAGTGSSYGMSLHADYMHFSMSPLGKQPPPNNAIPLGAVEHRNGLEGNWLTLNNSALASGAFPIGLAARALKRTGTIEYDNRMWPVRQEGQPTDGSCECTKLQAIEPAWPNPWNGNEPRESWKYEFINVDGGIANNEPFEMARRCLAGDDSVNPRSAKTADRAVLMIDPFPNDATVDFKYDATKTEIVAVIGSLLNAITSQLRFKTEELELAKRQDIHSRWIIAPTRWENDQQAQFALASGGLMAFGGFMHRKFREHDYQLGRRNCQKFLRETLILHEDNPIFAGHWTEAAKERLQREMTIVDGKTEPGMYLPIIPLYGNCNIVVQQEPWPALPPNAATEKYFYDLRDKLHTRAAKLYFSWVDSKVSGTVDRGLLKAGWYLFGLKKASEGIFGSLIKKLKGEHVDGIHPIDIVQPLIDMIKDDFRSRKLL